MTTVWAQTGQALAQAVLDTAEADYAAVQGAR